MTQTQDTTTRDPWVLSPRRAAVAWALVAVVVVVAIVVGVRLTSDGGTQGAAPPAGDTSPSPSGSASGSGTPSPTATGVVVPAAARAQTWAGAEAFVRFFIDQLEVAWTEPRPGLIKVAVRPGVHVLPED